MGAGRKEETAETSLLPVHRSTSRSASSRSVISTSNTQRESWMSQMPGSQKRLRMSRRVMEMSPRPLSRRRSQMTL